MNQKRTRVLFTLLLLLFTAFLALGSLIFIRTKPQPIQANNASSTILTNTVLSQLLSPKDYFYLLFSESASNPYVYGWEGGTLYYTDGWGHQYMWDENTDQSQRVQLKEPKFHKQERVRHNCNLENKPNYEYFNNFPGGIESIGCTAYIQGNVKVELWPMAVGDLLSFGAKHIAIEYNDHKIMINELRIISDIVISEDEQSIAIVASNPQVYPDGFAPTDIHVLTLP